MKSYILGIVLFIVSKILDDITFLKTTKWNPRELASDPLVLL
jgi:hypothetical protein